MDKVFYGTYPEAVSAKINDARPYSFAFQEKLFFDAYTEMPSNSLYSSKALNSKVLYKEAILRTEQRLFLEILFLQAMYLYYRDYDLFRPSPKFGHSIPSNSNKSHLYRWLESDSRSLSKLNSNDLVNIAEHSIGKPIWAFTQYAAICDRGNLGCAATVSKLLQEAHFPIAGSASVVGLVSQLSNLGCHKIKIDNKDQFRKGDIVFGLNGVHAHIGIISRVENNRILVCDNSSSSGVLKERTLEQGGSFAPNGRFAGHLYVMRKD